MKFCPTCQTRYEEEILRFCIKDGTPLVEETIPQFTELPSEASAEDLGEMTIVRKPATPDGKDGGGGSRLVIPTSDRPKTPEAPPSRQRRPQPPPPPQPNIFKVIVLTILGTLVVLAGIGALIWSLRADDASNTTANQNSNLNATVDTNLNTNLNMNGFNMNMNPNTNLNWNVNFNVNANTNVNINSNKANANVNTNVAVRPSPSPTPAANTAGGANRPANRPASNTSRPPDAARSSSANR